MKTLTIAVPSYNAEAYIDKCLTSFEVEAALARIDVIVVNDGSTDGTLSKAKAYAEKHPESFRYIDKPNGGHGSGINAALDAAEGKYFTVIDSDDWIVSGNFAALLDILDKTDADVVLKHYNYVDMTTDEHTPVRIENAEFGREYTLEEYMKLGAGARSAMVFHGITYRTAMLKEDGMRLLEKVFYEDQQYATVPFRSVKTVLPIDMFFYEYMIGNAAQSVSDENQVKRIDQLEKVFWEIEKELRAGSGMSPAAKEYFTYKLAEMLLSIYSIMLIKDTDRKRGLLEAKRLYAELTEKNPELAKCTARKYRISRVLHAFGFTGKTLAGLKDSALYALLKRAAH